MGASMRTGRAGLAYRYIHGSTGAVITVLGSLELHRLNQTRHEYFSSKTAGTVPSSARGNRWRLPAAVGHSNEHKEMPS